MRTVQGNNVYFFSLPDVVQFNLSRPDHEQYSTPVLNALYQRFEPPISTNRWDSPLFLALKVDFFY